VKRAVVRVLEAVLTEVAYRVAGRRRRTLCEERERLPRALYIEATNICNAKCIFCAYPQMQRAKSTMDMELFSRVVAEYVAAGGRHVSLTPIVGDPTVDPRLFERLDLLAGHEEIATFHFFTNGILLDDEMISKLLAYGGRLRVAVSMGGFDRVVYHRLMGVDRFDTVWRNLTSFIAQKEASGSETRLEIHVRCGPADRCGAAWDTVTRWRDEGRIELAVISDFDSWAGAIGDDTLASNGLEPRAMPHKRGACELLYMKPVVLADGRVNGCACRDAEGELIVGDLNRQSLAEVLSGDELARLRRRHHHGDYPEVCRRCTYYVSIHNPVRSRITSSDLSWAELD